MTGIRPFTTIAAVIFALMAVVHAYRLATDFQLIVGSHTIPLNASWAGLLITALLSVGLFREARRQGP